MNYKLLLLILLASIHASPQEYDVTDEDLLMVCGSEERKSLVYDIMSSHVFSGEIPFMAAVQLQSATGTNREKLEMILKILKDNSLPTLPPCLNVTGDFKEVVYFDNYFENVTVAANGTEKVPANETGEVPAKIEEVVESNRTVKVPVKKRRPKLPAEILNMSPEERKQVCIFYELFYFNFFRFLTN